VESSSIHFLKARLCIGCTKGFEIVDLETLDTQSMLDPSDESLDFVLKRDTPLKPMAIYRIDSEFLLCYDGAFVLVCVGSVVTWQSRIRFLHQPRRLALTTPVHGALGRPADRLW
jgi:hypothetical protein